jgi:hypothetical protein
MRLQPVGDDDVNLTVIAMTVMVIVMMVTVMVVVIVKVVVVRVAQHTQESLRHMLPVGGGDGGKGDSDGGDGDSDGDDCCSGDGDAGIAHTGNLETRSTCW